MSQVVPGLLGIFGPVTMVVMSGRTSRDIPGLLGIFGPVTMVVTCGRTSRDVPSCPRTSWDLWTCDYGSHVW